MRLINYILMVGLVAGFLASLPRIGFRTIIYTVVATIGALVGVSLAIGDAPLYMEHPTLFNEMTIPAAAAVLFVCIGLVIERIRNRNRLK